MATQQGAGENEAPQQGHGTDLEIIGSAKTRDSMNLASGSFPRPLWRSDPAGSHISEQIHDWIICTRTRDSVPHTCGVIQGITSGQRRAVSNGRS